MKITWIIEKEDIKNLQKFVKENETALVKEVYRRNIERRHLHLSKDVIIKAIVMGLITSQQPSGPNTKVGLFIQTKPFPITYGTLKNSRNSENNTKKVLLEHGLNRFINRIPGFLSENFKFLESTKWKLFTEIERQLNGKHTKEQERFYADQIDDKLKGFGPKQSRNILQALGLTRYEIPIDSRITNWLNNFGFPVKLNSTALSDKDYYHFVSDGFQHLCEKADLYPCIVDASIFSSYDNGEWTTENVIY